MNEKLGNICEFLNGGTPSKEMPHYYGGEIPWITSADITGPIVDTVRSFITEEAVQKSATNKVEKGTVLLVTRTGVGKVAIAGKALCFSQDITAIKPDKNKLSTAFLVHFLKAQQGHFERHARGATIKGITREVVTDLDISLPPLPEQRRIAAILDKTDDLRARRREALTQLDELTKSIFIEMFGDPVHNTKNMPKAKLGDVAIFENGDRSSNYPSGDEIKKSGVLFLSTKNINNHQFDLTIRAFITEDKFASLSRGKAQKGDLLITLRGTLGSCCIFDCQYETAFINAQMMIIRPKPNLTPQYLHALISSRQFQDLFSRIGQGAAVPQLTATQLGQLEIPVPTLDLQLSFVDKISATKKSKASQEHQLTELHNLFASLQHRAFRGEL